MQKQSPRLLIRPQATRQPAPASFGTPIKLCNCVQVTSTSLCEFCIPLQIPLKYEMGGGFHIMKRDSVP